MTDKEIQEIREGYRKADKAFADKDYIASALCDIPRLLEEIEQLKQPAWVREREEIQASQEFVDLLTERDRLAAENENLRLTISECNCCATCAYKEFPKRGQNSIYPCCDCENSCHHSEIFEGVKDEQ